MFLEKEKFDSAAARDIRWKELCALGVQNVTRFSDPAFDQESDSWKSWWTVSYSRDSYIKVMNPPAEEVAQPKEDYSEAAV